MFFLIPWLTAFLTLMLTISSYRPWLVDHDGWQLCHSLADQLSITMVYALNYHRPIIAIFDDDGQCLGMTTPIHWRWCINPSDTWQWSLWPANNRIEWHGEGNFWQSSGHILLCGTSSQQRCHRLTLSRNGNWRCEANSTA